MMRTFPFLSAAIALVFTGAIVPAPALAQRPDGPPAGHDRFRDKEPLTRDEQKQLRQYTASLSGAERRGWELINRMMQADRRQAFVAREVRLQENGKETEFWVRRNPKRGLRCEGVRPAGVIMLDDRNKMFFYNPKERNWVSLPSLQARSQSMIDEIARRMLRGNLRARLEGQDTVAGRPADIVRVETTADGDGRRSAPSRRFWVDRATGLRVKQEAIRPDGRLSSSAYYLSVDFAPRFRADEFDAPANATPVEQEWGRKTEYASVEDARRAGVDVPDVTYLPKGFTLRVVEVKPDRHGPGSGPLTLRFGNGLTTVSLTRFPAAAPLPFLENLTGPNRSGFIAPPSGMEGRAYTWQDGNSRYILLGTLPADELKRISRSVK